MRMAAATLGCLVLGAVGAQAEMTGDPARGPALAQGLCSTCHLVDARQRGPVPDGVPSFMAIAADAGEGGGQMAAQLLQPPHPQMPPPPIDRQGLRDLVAYIRSLGPS